MKIIQQFPGEDAQLLDRLRTLYIAEGDTMELPSYTGDNNPDLDREISETEVRAALMKIRPGSAPGQDGVTNKLLRNLDDNSIYILTQYYNLYWTTGTLPPSWKHAKITLIPKPGKPLKLEYLRPISLTSCVGKVLEHIIHAR